MRHVRWSCFFAQMHVNAINEQHHVDIGIATGTKTNEQ